MISLDVHLVLADMIAADNQSFNMYANDMLNFIFKHHKSDGTYDQIHWNNSNDRGSWEVISTIPLNMQN